jgi:TspO/MBR family
MCRLLAETGLLLTLLNASKELHWRTHDLQLKNLVDLGTWALLVFGSDGIVGLLHKITDRFGWTTPRQTLKESQDTWYKNIVKPSWTPPDAAFPIVWIPLKVRKLLCHTMCAFCC